MTDLIIEILGWIGSITLIAAYFLNSKNVLTAQSVTYQLMNIMGSILLGINCFYNAAFPSAVLNVIWLFIGLVYLAKMKQKVAE